MDKAMLRAVLACVLWMLHIPAVPALDSGTRKAVEAATFEFRAPAAVPHAKDLIGTAFAIGPNEFVTAAHLFDKAIGSHFKHPLLVDARNNAYPVADILQFSEQQDYVIFSLDHSPRINPLPARGSEPTEPDVYFAGWRSDGRRVVIEHGTFAGLTRDEESKQFDWLRFSGELWGAGGGGPLLDASGHVIGVVQARARNGDANYAVPIGLLPNGAPERAHIHSMEMLRSMMPVVSSVKPLEAEIPLPMSFETFAHELEQLRLAYVDREVGPLLEATRRNFVLIGEAAADVCSLLNGENCECKARTGVSGMLVVNDVRPNELMHQVNAGKGLLKVAGAVVFRLQEGSEAEGRRRDVSSDPRLHLSLALKGQSGPDHPLETSATAAVRAAADQDGLYVDFRDRTWHMRTWSLLDQDLELVSLARKLPDGYVILTRTIPAALRYAAELQLQFVANMVYYGCDELQGEGMAQVADTMYR